LLLLHHGHERVGAPGVEFVVQGHDLDLGVRIDHVAVRGHLAVLALIVWLLLPVDWLVPMQEAGARIPSRRAKDASRSYRR
jgi:hypothetical protein